MPYVGRFACKVTLLVPLAGEDNVLCQRETFKLAVDLVDVAVPLVVLCACGYVLILNKILDVPFDICLEDGHRIVAVYGCIFLICRSVHKVPIVVDSIVGRSDCYVHNVVGLSHIHSQ